MIIQGVSVSVCGLFVVWELRWKVVVGEVHLGHIQGRN